jgi:sugar phosphate isomerase/epimerase
MKLGVFTVLFGGLPFEKALDYIAKSGLDAVEIGTGNYPGDKHCPLDELVSSKTRAKDWKSKVEERGLTISALSCHGNPLHPDRKFASAHHNVQRKTIKLAETLGIDTVVVFSGCPGDSDNAKYPNWVTCSWPPDFSAIVQWQWEKKVIPYWKREAAFAKDHSVKLAFEMHPGFVVYSAYTLMRLREECGDNIGANFDPSHLFWQQMDPIECVRYLGKIIYHVHAKDCKLYPPMATKGVLDTSNYKSESTRAWIFRTVGYGHGEEWWRDFVSTLRMFGYDGALSIEHEDSLMSIDEGFRKGADFLKGILLKEKPGDAYWA